MIKRKKKLFQAKQFDENRFRIVFRRRTLILVDSFNVLCSCNENTLYKILCVLKFYFTQKMHLAWHALDLFVVKDIPPNVNVNRLLNFLFSLTIEFETLSYCKLTWHDKFYINILKQNNFVNIIEFEVSNHETVHTNKTENLLLMKAINR